MTLPGFFVWTRYGIESGEDIGSIFRRKERERISSGGTFLWGVGNSIAPSVRQLLMHLDGTAPAIVFSPMLAAPKRDDVSPDRVVTWTVAHGIDGHEWQMPKGTAVTSRAAAGGSDKLRHYALVCGLDAPITERRNGQRFAIEDLTNFVSGNKVGHSQVSSVVHRTGQTEDGPYVAAVVATLRYPYVIDLSCPDQRASDAKRPSEGDRHPHASQLPLIQVA